MKKYLSFCVLLLLLSCHESSKRQSREKAEKLYSEGMKILDQRLLIQDSDKEKAMELNEKAIENLHLRIQWTQPLTSRLHLHLNAQCMQEIIKIV
jgi:hypothetical protein